MDMVRSCLKVSIRFHRGGLPHAAGWSDSSSEYVSIRFHRGGLSHGTDVRRHGAFWQVSIRFHRGGLSHLVKEAHPRKKASVSIRFHRGGPSHDGDSNQLPRAKLFQSAFIAVARLTIIGARTNLEVDEFQSAFIAVARLTLVRGKNPGDCRSFNPLSSRWPVSLF